MRTTNLTFPIVHLNGTSGSYLKVAYEEAGYALAEALEHLRQTAPHGRDYYVSKDPEALAKATAEYTARVEKLSEMIEDMAELSAAVRQQIDARKR